MMAFFSGYPLIYILIFSFAGNKTTRSPVKQQLVSLLPIAYALAGTLYLGLVLKTLYPDYSFAHIKEEFQNPFLKIWGLVSIFFWIPVFRKRPVISLLHSLVFLFLIIKDFYIQLTSAFADKNVLQNDMKIYMDSILLNIAVFIVTALVFYSIVRFRKKRKSSLK